MAVLVRSFRSGLRRLLYVAAIAIITLLLWVSTRPKAEIVIIDDHRIGPSDLVTTRALRRLDFARPDADYKAWYNSPAAAGLCAVHGYPVYTPHRRAAARRKVFDLFLVDAEVDFLEIRLRTLYDYVDYFVLIESPLSVLGQPKNMTIRDNWQRFARFQTKIIYRELEVPADFHSRRPIDHETLQRDAALTQVLPTLTGDQTPRNGDVLLVSNVDEIPRPASLLVLRSCAFPHRLTLASKFHYYSFEFLHDESEWPHPQATVFAGKNTIMPTSLRSVGGRSGEGGTGDVLANAGWHCSNCFATTEQFLGKMARYSHSWLDDNWKRSRKRVVEAVRSGFDIWSRTEDSSIRIAHNVDIPDCLLLEPDRFQYMLNRGGKTAGFTDLKR